MGLGKLMLCLICPIPQQLGLLISMTHVLMIPISTRQTEGVSVWIDY